jgi:hypothetical protein
VNYLSEVVVLLFLPEHTCTELEVPLVFQRHTGQKVCQDDLATDEHTEQGKIQPAVQMENFRSLNEHTKKSY